MSEAMTPLSKDNPIMVAWEAYTQTGKYLCNRQWAVIKEHTEGSLWAAFLEGWNCHDTTLKARIERLEKALENLTHITFAGEVRVDYYKEAKAVLEEGKK